MTVPRSWFLDELPTESVKSIPGTSAKIAIFFTLWGERSTFGPCRQSGASCGRSSDTRAAMWQGRMNSSTLRVERDVVGLQRRAAGRPGEAGRGPGQDRRHDEPAEAVFADNDA